MEYLYSATVKCIKLRKENSLLWKSLYENCFQTFQAGAGNAIIFLKNFKTVEVKSLCMVKYFYSCSSVICFIIVFHLADKGKAWNF